MKNLFALVLAVFAFSWSHVVYSQTSTDKAYEVFRTKVTTFGNHTTNFSTNGQALVGSGRPVWGPLPGGGSSVVVPSNVNIGKTAVSVAVRGAVTGATVAGVVRGLVMPGGWVVTGIIMALPAVLDMLNQDGIRVVPDDDSGGSGRSKFQRKKETGTFWKNMFGAGSYPDPLSACISTHPVATHVSYLAPHIANCKTSAGSLGQVLRSGTPVFDWADVTYDDIAPYIAARPTPPAVINDLINAGASIPVTPDSITGPAKVTHADSNFNTVILPLPSTTETETFIGQPPFIGQGKIGNGYRDVRVDGVPQFEGGAMSTQLQGTVVSIPTNTTTSTSYNPATNTTTVTKTTNYPGANVEQTVKSETALTYKPGSEASVDGTTKTTVTTTVKDSAGQTVSTNTTTDTSSRPRPDDVKDTDPCKQNPDVIGCAKLGEAPAADLLPQKTVPVSWSPVSFASPASCPAPYSGTISVLSFQKTWSFSFDPMCDLMISLRALFLAIGAATAAYVFMEGLKA